MEGETSKTLERFKPPTASSKSETFDLKIASSDTFVSVSDVFFSIEARLGSISACTIPSTICVIFKPDPFLFNVLR